MPACRSTVAHAVAFGLVLALAPFGAGPATATPALSQARLLEVAKDAALLRVELTEPAVATVAWGEEPGAFGQRATSEAADTTHEMRLTGLSPDRRYFYQVEADGAPVGDMATFVSGRSWITRRALLLATAAAPAATPESSALADRLFAREADALILLSGEGDPASFATQHARAMGDRMVLTGPASSARATSIADVVVGWGSGTALQADADLATACWRVACSPDDASALAADVVLRAAESDQPSSLRQEGDRLIISLAGLDHAALDFRGGTLTATLARGGSTDSASLTRICPVAIAAPTPAVSADPFADGSIEISVDGDHHDADCGQP